MKKCRTRTKQDVFSELQWSGASSQCTTQIIGVSLEFHIKTMGIEDNHSSESPRKILQQGGHDVSPKPSRMITDDGIE